MQTQYKT